MLERIKFLIYEALGEMKYIEILLDNLVYYRNIETGFKNLDTLKTTIKFALLRNYIKGATGKYTITQKGVDKYRELKGLNDKED